MTNFSRWIEALESGDYAQTKNVLRQDKADGTSCFCVAGVACELAIADGVPMTWDNGAYSWHEVECDCGCEGDYDARTNSSIPRPVKAWLGVFDEPRIPGGKFGTMGIITANDSEGKTFAEIASGLREAYPSKVAA